MGLGIARKLAASAYNVVAVARRESEPLVAAMRELERDGGGSLHFKPFDLGDLSDVPTLIKGIRKEFGPIYGLVNNAALGTSGILATMHDAEIERLVRVNLLSPVVVTKYVARSMMVARGGRIVNIASVISFTGYSGLSVYGATKASIIGFTRSLARELGPVGINVNAVAPGFVDTDMTHSLGEQQRDQLVRRSALRRLADIDDIADAVEFLIGEKAKNITGTVLTVDAGSTA